MSTARPDGPRIVQCLRLAGAMQRSFIADPLAADAK